MFIFDLSLWAMWFKLATLSMVVLFVVSGMIVLAAALMFEYLERFFNNRQKDFEQELEEWNHEANQSCTAIKKHHDQLRAIRDAANKERRK